MENSSEIVSIIDYRVRRSPDDNNPLLDPTLLPRGRTGALRFIQEQHLSSSGSAPIGIVPDIKALEERLRVRAILMGQAPGSGLPPVS